MIEESGQRETQDPRGRIPLYRGLLFASLGLAGVTALLVYVWLMSNLFPQIRVVDLRVAGAGRDRLAALREERSGDPRRIRILRTAENVACATRLGVDLDAEATGWRDLAARVAVASEFVDERGIPAPGAGVDLLVVPWCLCLSEPHRRRIDAYLRAGGGLLISGPGQEGEALGLAGGPLAGWIGARAASALGEPRSRFLVPAGRTAPGAGLEPGQRLELPLSRLAIGLDVPSPVLFWSDWQLRPLAGASGAWQAAAAVARAGAGRVAWFGFAVSHQLPGRKEIDGVRGLALLWAAGDAVAALAPWPGGRSHAVVLAVDGEGSGTQVLATTSHLARQGFPPTLFLDTRSLERDPGLRAAIAESAEVGSRGDRRAVLAGEPRPSQRRRLRESRSRIQEAAGRRVRGVHPPEERFDAFTLDESVAAGYEYLLGDADYDRTFPRFVSIAGSRFALLSRSGADDDYAKLAAATGGADPGAGFVEDAARLRRLGGLYLLSLRPDLLGARERRPVLDRLLAELRAGEPWLATAGEVVSWSRARSAVRLSVLDGAAPALRLANEGAETVRTLSLELFDANLAPRRIAVTSLAAGAEQTVDLPGPAVVVATP